MARRYRPVDREQQFLLPVSMTEWLPDDHLVWFIIDAVARLDTTAFHRRARLGGVGRQGYDPDMLLTLLVYAMAHGARSSRQIERLCHTDVAFRIICAQDVPDHTVLARFRQHHEQALGDLLTATLRLAAELGMIRLGVVAFDGTKIAANASMAANRSEDHLRKLAEQYLADTAATDTAEDTLFGDDRGDEPPPDLRDRTSRHQRIQQALDEIAARQAAADQPTGTQQQAAADYTTALATTATGQPGTSQPGAPRKPPTRSPSPGCVTNANTPAPSKATTPGTPKPPPKAPTPKAPAPCPPNNTDASAKPKPPTTKPKPPTTKPSPPATAPATAPAPAPATSSRPTSPIHNHES